jgi:hypothetical protein
VVEGTDVVQRPAVCTHAHRVAKLSAFRPTRPRRVTSLELSEAVASVFT